MAPVTAKLVEEAVERQKNAPANYYSDLQTKWRCESKSCRNFGLYCIQGKHGQPHRILGTNDLRVWNAAIVNGESTLDSPPLSIHPQTAPTRSRKRKTEEDYSSDLDEFHRPQRPYQPAVNVHVHQGGAKSSSIVKPTPSPNGTPSKPAVIPEFVRKNPTAAL